MGLRWIGMFGVLCLCSILSVELRAQNHPKAAPPEKASNTEKAENHPEWTARLMRQIQQQCQEDGHDQRRSCFDVPVGGKIADLVPLGEVSEAEKSLFWAPWNGILQPEHFPKNPAKVLWRKALLTKVKWAPRNAVAKTWGPPTADWICAKWEAGGRTFVAIDRMITVKLIGAARIDYRHPKQENVLQDEKVYIIESEIDKAGLYNLLLTLFRVPWESDEEFVVRWALVNKNPDNLRVQSLRLHREPEPPHWQEWFDDFSFELSGDDPQYLTCGFWVPPKR